MARGRPKSPHRLRAEADVLRLVDEAIGIYKPSLRNLWYKVVHYVKPEYDDPKNTGKAYKHFVRWVTDLRKSGDLVDDALTDEGRGEHCFPTWDTAESLLGDAVESYYPTLWEPGSEVELWCESNSTATQLLPLCQRWRVNLVPLSGFTWQFARDQAHRVEHQYGFDGVRILYLGDHDCSGYLIELQAQQHLRGVGATFSWERVALLPDQARGLPEVEEQKGEQRHTTPEWEEAHSHHPAKVELEAFDVPELLEIVEERIRTLAPESLGEYQARTQEGRDELRERLGFDSGSLA